MQVIKQGRRQTGWAKEFTCTGAGNGDGGCDAVLLVEQGDLYHTYHNDYGGGRDVFTTFTCSECGVETDVKGVPPNLMLPDKAEWLKARELAATATEGGAKEFER